MYLVLYASLYRGTRKTSGREMIERENKYLSYLRHAVVIVFCVTELLTNTVRRRDNMRSTNLKPSITKHKFLKKKKKDFLMIER